MTVSKRPKAKPSRSRFQQQAWNGESRLSFLVRCPKCGGCAQVTQKSPYRDIWQGAKNIATMVCEHCGATAESKQGFIGESKPITDWYFGLPLWLQTQCCGETLWASDIEHLNVLKNYVSATLRPRTTKQGVKIRMSYPMKPRVLPDEPILVWNGNSTTARLPKWMVLRKNREAVLRGLRRLEAMLLVSMLRPAR